MYCTLTAKNLTLDDLSRVNSRILISQNDFLQAYRAVKPVLKCSVGFPEIPNVKWEDVAGLESAKQAL